MKSSLLYENHVFLKQLIWAAGELERAALSGPGAMGLLEHTDGAAPTQLREVKAKIVKQ